MTSKSAQYIQNSNFLLIALWIKLLELLCQSLPSFSFNNHRTRLDGVHIPVLIIKGHDDMSHMSYPSDLSRSSIESIRKTALQPPPAKTRFTGRTTATLSMSHTNSTSEIRDIYTQGWKTAREAQLRNRYLVTGYFAVPFGCALKADLSTS